MYNITASAYVRKAIQKAVDMKSSKLFRMPDKVRNKPFVTGVKETRRIAIIGSGRGVGVSLLSGFLASYAAGMAAWEDSVSLIEMGTPYFYDAYGIEKRFVHRDFLALYEILNRRGSIKGLANVEENINWVLRRPPVDGRDPLHADVACALHMVHNAQGTLLLFDCSGITEELLWELLPEMDGVVLVVDPMPSSLIPAGGVIRQLRLTADKTVLVVNKMNKGVHKGELCRFIGTKDFLEFPLIGAENLYKAEYNCVLPYALPQVRKETEKHVINLWNLIFQGLRE
jgi:hypothetical protein